MIITTTNLPSHLQKASIITPWGKAWIVGNGETLSGWWFEHQNHAPNRQLGWHEVNPSKIPVKQENPSTPLWETVQEAPFISLTLQWLECYIEGHAKALPPLHLYGSPFMLTVWTTLLDIPWGKTWSYAQLAKAVFQRLQSEQQLNSVNQCAPLVKTDMSPLFTRSVASAVGRNPISVIIPCHRVVGTSGQLCGYAGGVERKIALLKHEGAILL